MPFIAQQQPWGSPAPQPFDGVGPVPRRRAWERRADWDWCGGGTHCVLRLPPAPQGAALGLVLDEGSLALNSVQPGSVAERRGAQRFVGRFVTGACGRPVYSSADLEAAFAEAAAVGGEVPVRFSENPLPPPPPAVWAPPAPRSLQLPPAPEVVVRKSGEWERAGLLLDAHTLVLDGVEPRRAAARSGAAAYLGHRLTHVDGRHVFTAEQAAAALQGSAAPRLRFTPSPERTARGPAPLPDPWASVGGPGGPSPGAWPCYSASAPPQPPPPESTARGGALSPGPRGRPCLSTSPPPPTPPPGAAAGAAEGAPPPAAGQPRCPPRHNPVVAVRRAGAAPLGVVLGVRGGALVLDTVLSGSAADEGGMRRCIGLRLLRINGTPAESEGTARAALAGDAPVLLFEFAPRD